MQTTQFIIMGQIATGLVSLLQKPFEQVCFAYEIGINTRLGFGHKLTNAYN